MDITVVSTQKGTAAVVNAEDIFMRDAKLREPWRSTHYQALVIECKRAGLREEFLDMNIKFINSAERQDNIGEIDLPLGIARIDRARILSVFAGFPPDTEERLIPALAAKADIITTYFGQAGMMAQVVYSTVKSVPVGKFIDIFDESGSPQIYDAISPRL